MGNMKDYILDLEIERFDEWIEDNYPDIICGSEEWEQAAHLYNWEQEFFSERRQWEYEHGLFVASLNNVHQRFLHANNEMQKLKALLKDPQPELVYRMSFVHAVTVMEAYLMYCARALLEHDWPLRRFRDVYYQKSGRIKNTDKLAALDMDLSLFRPAARNFVSRMTFHNPKTIERYFSAVLHVPPVWPVTPLAIIAEWRNDLVHRNGVDENDVPREISEQLLKNTLQKVYDLIDAADLSMKQEIDLFGNIRIQENLEIIASSVHISPTKDIR